MYASESSPPPQSISAPGTIHNRSITTTQRLANPPAPAPSRKRKRGQAASTAHAASPAPSDHGVTDLLASRTDLYARPILSIARGPVFIPVSEDSEWYKTDSVAVNRLGFRYVPAGINSPGSITPCRTIESNPTSFRISWEDRSQSLKVTKDGLGLGGLKGFRSARCNAPIREGKWYLEVKIELGGGDRVGDAPESLKGDGNHVRLGWGRREAPLNGPVGLDGYSYGYRDKSGEKVTVSRPRSYGKPYKSGDVIGMYISLPPLRQPNKKDPHDPAHIHRERIPIDLKGQEVFEILEYPVSKEMSALMESTIKPVNSASVPSSNNKKPVTGMGAKLPDRSVAPANPSPKAPVTTPLRPLPILQGSRIAFFVNGESQGIAFQDIYDFLPLPQTDKQRKSKGRRVKEGVKEHRENPFDDGTLGYYPMISLFNDATVKINPGPDFAYPPPPNIDAVLDGKHGHGSKPTSESSSVVESEGQLADLKMDIDDEAKPSMYCTWRPVFERYPQFMKEQWELDSLEEDEAKTEFERQKAKEEAGVATKAARARKTEAKKAASAKATAGNKKKKTAQAPSEGASKAGTPFPDDEIAAAANAKPSARKKPKKVEVQTLDIATLQAPPPRSATETPSGTPPPPISSAAAAAAAHLHLHLLPATLPNRPSPSPLRQSTAYQELDVEEEIARAAASQRDRDALPILIGPASHAPRSRAPPGSKEGRQRAAAAAAAAAAQVWSNIPSVTGLSPPVTPSQQRGNLMSLAMVAGSSAALPIPTPSSKPLPATSNALNHTPPRRVPRLGAPADLSRLESKPRGGTASVYNDNAVTAEGADDLDDLEGEFIAAAAQRPWSDGYAEEEEEEEEDEGEGRGGVNGYAKGRGGVNEEGGGEAGTGEREQDMVSLPADDGDEDGATTDGGDSVYPYDIVRRAKSDADMAAGEDTDDGGGTLGDDVDGYQSPA